MARSGSLYAISIVAHVGIAIVVAAFPAKKVIETYQVWVPDQRKKPEPPRTRANPSPERPRTRQQVQRTNARTLPRPPSAVGAAASPSDPIADFGVALDNLGSHEGIPVRVAALPTVVAPAAPVKKLLIPKMARGRENECSEPLVKAKVSNLRKPEFTEAARAAGVSGRIRLRIEIDELGKVTSAAIIQGLGYGLDESALAAARATAFSPATRCGKAVASTFNFAVRFGV